MKKSVALLFFLMLCFGQGWSQEVGPDAAKKAGQSVIIVYGSNDCHHCTDTKKYLTEHDIAFVFYDIDRNPEALQEMLSKLRKHNISTSNLSIPVIDKGGAIFTNDIPFEAFLEKLRQP